MAFTIQQERLTGKVAEVLLTSKDNTRRTCSSLQAQLTDYPGASALVVDRAQTYANGLRQKLDKILSHQTEIENAATAVGADVQDFHDRYNALDSACSTLENATEATIAADLQSILDALPAETML